MFEATENYCKRKNPDSKYRKKAQKEVDSLIVLSNHLILGPDHCSQYILSGSFQINKASVLKETITTQQNSKKNQSFKLTEDKEQKKSQAIGAVLGTGLSSAALVLLGSGAYYKKNINLQKEIKKLQEKSRQDWIEKYNQKEASQTKIRNEYDNAYKSLDADTKFFYQNYWINSSKPDFINFDKGNLREKINARNERIETLDGEIERIKLLLAEQQTILKKGNIKDLQIKRRKLADRLINHISENKITFENKPALREQDRIFTNTEGRRSYGRQRTNKEFREELTEDLARNLTADEVFNIQRKKQVLISNLKQIGIKESEIKNLFELSKAPSGSEKLDVLVQKIESKYSSWMQTDPLFLSIRILTLG